MRCVVGGGGGGGVLLEFVYRLCYETIYTGIRICAKSTNTIIQQETSC